MQEGREKVAVEELMVRMSRVEERLRIRMGLPMAPVWTVWLVMVVLGRGHVVGMGILEMVEKGKQIQQSWS